MTWHDLWVVSPQLAMAGLALIVVSADLIFRNKALLIWITVIGLIVPMALAIGLWVDTPADPTGFYGAITADRFSLFFQFLFIGTTAAVILGTATYRRNFPGLQGEFVALMLMTVTGMMLLASARDLITAYVALELSSLPVAAMAAFLRTDRSLEAGLKFLLLSAVSSAVLLYGLVFVYGFTGTTNIAGIFEQISMMRAEGLLAADQPFGSYALMFGIVMIVAGFGFKLAIVPFQMWVPDVYEGMPSPMVAFLSVASKGSAFAIILRVLYTGFGTPEQTQEWAVLFAILAAVTMTVGNLMALYQTNIKRLLGYSTVAQTGYMLVGVAAVAANTDAGNLHAGPQGVLFYMAAYAFTNVAAVVAIIAITNRTGTDMISGFAGMARRSPMLAVILTLGMISLIGVPPTAGFMAKVFVFSAAVNSDLAWLALFGVLNSVVSAYYYLRVVRTMFLDEPPSTEPVRAGAPVWAAGAFASAGLLFFGVAPWWLLDLAERAVRGVVS